jgi:vacuolar protein sorting-associated protein 35
LAPISSYSTLQTVLALSNYLKLLHAQTYHTRRSVAAAVSQSLLSSGTLISTKDDVEGVLELVKVLIREGGQPSPIQTNLQRIADNEDIIEEQGWLARLVHLLSNKDSPEIDFDILKAVRTAYWEAPNERCKYTTGSLITAGLKLVGRFKARQHLVCPSTVPSNFRIMIGRLRLLRCLNFFIKRYRTYFARYQRRQNKR